MSRPVSISSIPPRPPIAPLFHRTSPVPRKEASRRSARRRNPAAGRRWQSGGVTAYRARFGFGAKGGPFGPRDNDQSGDRQDRDGDAAGRVRHDKPELQSGADRG